MLGPLTLDCVSRLCCGDSCKQRCQKKLLFYTGKSSRNRRRGYVLGVKMRLRLTPILVHCQKTKNIWRRVSFIPDERQGYGQTVKEWWSHIIQKAGHTERKVKLAATIVRKIWNARNATIFENQMLNPGAIVKQANCMIEEQKSRSPRKIHKPHPRRYATSSQWNPLVLMF